MIRRNVSVKDALLLQYNKRKLFLYFTIFMLYISSFAGLQDGRYNNLVLGNLVKSETLSSLSLFAEQLDVMTDLLEGYK